MPPVERDDYAHVAQLVEHFLGKEEVTDSSSVMGSRRFLRKLGAAKICVTVALPYANLALPRFARGAGAILVVGKGLVRSEEHTSELQSH